MIDCTSELDQAIRSVKEGDTSAFGRIIDQTERQLRASLALQVPDRELIDEVAHLAYITAFEKLGDYHAPAQDLTAVQPPFVRFDCPGCLWKTFAARYPISTRSGASESWE